MYDREEVMNTQASPNQIHILKTKQTSNKLHHEKGKYEQKKSIVNANSSITSRHLWVCMCALTWKRFSNSRPQIPHAHTVVLCASTCFVIFFKSLTGFRP